MKYIDTLGIRTPIAYVQNPIYDKTNNIYSLALAKDYLCQDDTLLFESDLIFETPSSTAAGRPPGDPGPGGQVRKLDGRHLREAGAR